MAYNPHTAGRHGGGYDPSTGPFVQTQDYQQSASGPAPHGGRFDPNSPFNPPLNIQPATVAPPDFRPQNTFSTQATATSNYRQPYPPTQPQLQPQHNNQPGIVSQLCACFR
ncbi:hypothetical protein BDU57DRAFT_514400 [Ampelomyces quisqualis]|uniref:Uncharacterized protein n=1 Tax=Ampelomyces quisqualis TaxID=50730 RepID=A0A6A5QRA6_AMPQU|nr:hypothetical protein BDU57DRAFT_514400 [Ampelomyces quisqualis]